MLLGPEGRERERHRTQVNIVFRPICRDSLGLRGHQWLHTHLWSWLHKSGKTVGCLL